MALKVLNITEEGRGGGPLKRIEDIARTLQDQGVETLRQACIDLQKRSFHF